MADLRHVYSKANVGSLVRCASACVALALGFALSASGASVPEGFVDEQVASGLTSPSAMAIMPDGRVLVTQQNGQVRIIKGDVMLSQRFHTVDADFTNEHGLLGVTTDPAFATNHFVYLYYTAKTPAPHNRIVRVTEANDVAVAGSDVVILDLPNVPSGTKWHMGGALHFGPDGKLYVAVGNHEDNPQTNSNSQNLANPFGKILRINKDGTVPNDNPFVSTPGAYKAIWMYGFRNPFTFAIQLGSGTMFVNDVGQGTWEEVNRGTKGGNYGWPSVEGSGSDSRFLNPAYAYSHSEGCCVAGATFYNPANPQFPASFVGKYLFGDFCEGFIRSLDPANNAVAPFVTGINFLVNIEVAPDGSVYYLARNQATGNPTSGIGTVSKITFTGSRVPRFTRHPASQTVTVGDPVTFTVAAEGATSFRWQRNGTDIAAATGTSFTIAHTALADDGARFRAVATNSFGSALSSEATLSVTTNHLPVATIVTPSLGTTYRVGDVVSFSGTGTDAEDGTLPASAFTWQVDFQHDVHAHPFVPPFGGSSSGSLTIPAADATDANVWYRIYLTVRDSAGATQTAFRDIRPKTALSDLTPSTAPINGWGPLERDMSNGEAGAGDGHTLSLGAIPYAKGLGVHAPAEVRYSLGGACSGLFLADVGVDDETSGRGSVVFQVWLDAVLAFDSGPIAGGDLRRSVNLSVAGKNELRLVVTDAGDGKSFDHADWAGARVTGCDGAAGVTISSLSVKDTANAASWSLRSNLQSGQAAYGDRTYTFAGVPASLAGAQWIRPANSSKAYTGAPLVTFVLSAAADVYVSLDDRVPPPSWIDGTWTDTGTQIVIRQSASVTRPASVYRKRFAAGQVGLGPWGNSTVNMYVIVVK